MRGPRCSGSYGVCLHAACLAIVLAAVPVRGQQAAPQPPPAAPQEAETPLYRLQPGDTLDVKFDYVPELNETVKVRPDGYISLPRVGEIRVQGLTAPELTAEIRARYAAVVRQPEATVIVREFAVQQVFVGGEVASPGVVPLHGQVTALQAILSTGGPRTTARLSDVVLLRYLGNNQAEVRRLDLRKVVEGKEQDAVLRPFDVVFVPRSRIARVGLFVEQYINSLVPRSIVFPYNLNTVVINRVEP